MTSIARAYRQAYSGLPRAVWLLAGVIFVNRAGTMVLPFLALYLKSEQGFTAAGAGRMLAVYGLGAIAGAQLGGWLTQRWGGVAVAFTGMGLSVPGFWVIPSVGSGAGLVAALLYLSVVFEAMRPAIATATTDFCPPERHAKAFALNRLAMNLGMSVGPVVGGVLATWDYDLLFYVNGAFAGLAAIVTAVSFGLHQRKPRLGSPAPPLRRRSPWADSTYLAYLGLQLASSIVFFQLIGAMPLFWSEQWGLSEADIGLLFVINTLLIVAVEMVLTDKLRAADPLKMVALGTGLICAGFGASVFGYGFAYACALVLVWTAGEMLAAPFTLSFVAQRSAGGARGAYMGLFSTTMAAAFVIGPLVGTALYEIDPQLPWWCCLVMAGVLPLGFVRLGRSVRGRQTTPSAPDSAAGPDRTAVAAS